MARYACEEISLPSGEKGIRLTDGSAGVDAVILPERGALWSAFGLRDGAGRRVELLYPPEAPQGGGSPVLFPVVGRSICDGELGSYRHRGVVRPMAIHGFAKDRPWQVSDAGADAGSARLTCSLGDSPETRESYPYPFRIDLTYRLREGVLSIEARVTNTGTETLPFHLGYHPFFAMPVLSGGERGRSLLEVPSRAHWELRNSCATGRLLPLAPGESYEPARPLADTSLDRVFAELKPDPGTGRAVTRLSDPDSGYTIEMRHDPAQFPVFVVYAPLGLPFACLEPWTGLPGGLGDDNPAGQGAWRLPPGERFEAVVTVRAYPPGADRG